MGIVNVNGQTFQGSLHWESAAAQLVDVLLRLKVDIRAIQAIPITGHKMWKVCPNLVLDLR